MWRSFLWCTIRTHARAHLELAPELEPVVPVDLPRPARAVVRDDAVGAAPLPARAGRPLLHRPVLEQGHALRAFRFLLLGSRGRGAFRDDLQAALRLGVHGVELEHGLVGLARPARVLLAVLAREREAALDALLGELVELGVAAPQLLDGAGGAAREASPPDRGRLGRLDFGDARAVRGDRLDLAPQLDDRLAEPVGGLGKRSHLVSRALEVLDRVCVLARAQRLLRLLAEELGHVPVARLGHKDEREQSRRRPFRHIREEF